jgi:2-polyprenyl-6-methoxyphenol hydroxylase-like FAD-dependent oxidoreductase
MTNVKEVPILIIGGGIGGLTSALGIARSGKPVYVLEQAPQFTEVGAGIQLGPNALRVLDNFGLLETIYDFSIFPQRHVVMNAMNGKELSSLDFGKAFKDRYGYPYAVMHRSDLLDTLVHACQANELITLLTNHKAVSVENQGERVAVLCENGLSYLGEAVIGADGLWSKTRQLFSNDSPICSQYVAYRGAVPLAEITATVDVSLDDKLTWVGPHVHLVQYPLRRKDLFNQVAVFRSPKYRAGMAESDDWGTPEELDEMFSQCHPTVRKAVTYMQRGRRWPMYDREPINNWTAGRITLLGDAAHPMLQYLAQGACQAIEDGACLAQKLGLYASDVEKALLAYQEERIPRTASVQRGARTWGEIKHTVDPVTTLLRDTLLAQRRSDDYSAVDWLYSHSV